MICPNYKNKEVFNGFNEMIEALGGRPMTEEEFRDSELRNLRTGPDYSAMEAAYIAYNRNGGNFMDATPLGKPSILFQTLLDHFNGDRNAAIIAKSNVYSDEFALWFGDWFGSLNVQDEDVEYSPVSKAVDENGEPLVVWHGTLAEFSIFDFDKLGEVTGRGYYTDKITGEKIPIDSSSAFFFTNNFLAAKSYKNLSIYYQNLFRARVYRNLQAIFLQNAFLFRKFEGNDAIKQKDFIDNIISPYLGFDVRKEANNITDGKSSLSKEQILKYADMFKAAADKIENLPDARGVSNMSNNLQTEKSELDFLLKNKLNLIKGIPLARFDDAVMSFVTGYCSKYITIEYEENKYVVYGLSNTTNSVPITNLNFDNLISSIKEIIKLNENDLLKEESEAHYSTQGHIMPVFLNVRNPIEHDYEGSAFPDRYKHTKHQTAYIAARQTSKAVKEGNDGVIYKSVKDPFLMDSFGVFNPNQIKHVENLGTWSTKDNNIYHLNIEHESLSEEESSQFQPASFVDSFGQEAAAKLLNGETVSSRDLMLSMLSAGIFDKNDSKLAQILALHDVPVRVGFNMGAGELAETITDGAASVILINPEEVRLISRGYFGTAMMHELVHAITIDIIDHPKTEADRQFVEQNHKTFVKLNNFFKNNEAYRFDGFGGLYALSNEKEFAAVFASDPAVRHEIFELADALDRVNNSKLMTRLKNLVNKLTKAIISRSVFNTRSTKELLSEYENILTKYLYNAPIIEGGNIPSKSKLRALIDAVDNKLSSREQFIESVKRLEKMTELLKNFVKLGKEAFRIDSKPKRGSVQITNWGIIKDALATRIDALRASKTNDTVTKTRLILITLSQLDLFTLEQSGMYYAVQNLLDTSIPLIIQDVDNIRAIRRSGGEFSNKDYMDQMHTNLSMYHSVFSTIKKMLDDDKNVQDMVRLFNAGITDEEKKISIDDIDEVKRHLQNAVSFTEEGMNTCEYLLKENIIHKFKEIANEVGAPDMADYIDAMNTDDSSRYVEDIGALQVWAGAPDAASNEAIRALTYLIQKSLTTATYNTAGTATDLLKLKQNLAKGEKEWDICELDEDGDFTGYLMRDLNFGKFYKNYEKELHRINQNIRDLFDIPDHDLDCRIAPKYDKKISFEGHDITAGEYFTIQREKWLNNNAERRYKSKYYEFYANLPQNIKDNLAHIRIEINAITSKYETLYDENGTPHYEQLSDEDWANINILWERRRALRSDYDEYGNLKKGKDLEEARKLREMYEELYQKDESGKKKERHFDRTGWAKERESIIRKYGKDSEELKRWDERNTRKKLKQNSYGEAIVFKKIEEEFGGINPDYGKEYEELGKKRTELLNNHRSANGEPDVDSMPEVIKNIIVEIDTKRSEIRKKADKKVSAKYYEIMDKYIERKYTRNFEKIYNSIKEEAERRLATYDADDIFTPSLSDIMYSMLNETYGYYRGGSDDVIGWDPGTFIPYSYLTTIVARDEEYMEYEPNDAWIDKSENDLLNDKFDESYGVAWVPKRFDSKGNKLYDNTEEFKKIQNSETLKALYEGVQKTITKSNEMYGRQYADNYLLPQRECTFLGKLRRSCFWGPVLKKLEYLLRPWKWGQIDPDVKTPLGVSSILNKDDEPNDLTEGQKEIEDIYGYRKRVSGTYPDGRSFKIIPQYFTKRLKYPQFMSRNIVDNTASYYAQAELYKQRELIRDDCEAIVDMIKMQRFKDSGTDGSIKRYIKSIGGLNSDLSNTYLYARLIVDRDLYDVQRFDVRIPFSNKSINVSKILGGWKRWTTARNLGLNPKVAIVGFLTTSFTHMLNGLVGYKYSTGDMWRANNIVLKELGKSIFEEKTFIGSRLTKNKMMLLLESMDMSSQLERKTEHSNRNRWIQALYKNSTFGLLSAADFCSKSVIMVSTLLSYRYVNGEFITRSLIEESKEAYGDNYQKMLDDFKKSKVTAWDIFREDGEKLSVDPKYEAAWEKIKHTAINKSIKNAEQADGMATRLQKAMMTRNFIGAFALIHRQYIPLMLQLTWGKRVYDYDAQEYKNGQFRTMFEYLQRLCASNALAAAGFGAIVGIGFGGFGIVPLITSTASTAYSLYLKFSDRSKGVDNRKSFKKSIKDKEFFHKEGSVKETVNSTANRYLIKQTLLEIALINCFIAPIANLMGAIADDWDKKDKLTRMVLQSLAYWLRAFLFESNAKYNLLDISNNLKTFSAGTAITDSGTDLLSNVGSVAGGIVSNTAANIFHINGSMNKSTQLSSAIYEAYSTYNNDANDNIVQRGAYKGWTKGQRALFKLLPVHNIYEQSLDPESKRRYQENQVMRLNKDDKRSLIYEAWKDNNPAILLDYTSW